MFICIHENVSILKQILLYHGFDKDIYFFKVHPNRYLLEIYSEYETLHNIIDTVILTNIRYSKYSIQIMK